MGVVPRYASMIDSSPNKQNTLYRQSLDYVTAPYSIVVAIIKVMAMPAIRPTDVTPTIQPYTYIHTCIHKLPVVPPFPAMSSLSRIHHSRFCKYCYTAIVVVLCVFVALTDRALTNVVAPVRGLLVSRR